MNTSRFVFSAGFTIGLLLSGSALASGPTSTLYVMNYGEFGGGAVSGLDLVQGSNENSFATGNSVDTTIAAAGDIRTFGYSQNLTGSRFNLAGSPLPGGPYTNLIANSQCHDGTSDGLHNYTVDYVTGDVLQFDRNWASPVTLFNANGSGGTAGWITMNAADGSFWLSQYGNSDLVEHRTHSGTLLGSFNSGINYSQGLALDPVDGTLWMSSGFTLYQFSQGGTALQNVTVNVQGSWYGMEFDTTQIPEPASLPLVAGGIAFLSLMLRIKSRKPPFTTGSRL
jgi:hypothetical protein